MSKSLLFNVNKPLYILWLLRNGRAKDWQSLANEFGISTDYVDSLGGILLHTLQTLKEVGLIVFEDVHDDKYGYGSPVPGKIELSKNWVKIQSALEISLTELSKLGSDSMIVTPYFGKANKKSKVVDLFVMMPFESVLKPVYEDHILNVAKDLKLTVACGDDFFTAHSIISDIWEAILMSRTVIADCTGRNPNVFYEIGLAHAVGRPVVLITQSSDDVPFDLRHLRYIQYEYTPRGMRIFEKRLTDTLKIELKLEEGTEPIRKRIVYIVADNTSKSYERLSQEYKEIEKMLTLTGMEERFPWSQHYRAENLQSAILENKPNIVHVVGGHGDPEALLIEDHLKKEYPVSPSTLIDIFKMLAGQVECVLLSACYSKEQADAIATQVNFVLGIPAEMGLATTDFAVEFYRALGAGRSIKEAYELGCNQLKLLGVAEHLMPILIKKIK